MEVVRQQPHHFGVLAPGERAANSVHLGADGGEQGASFQHRIDEGTRGRHG